MPFGPVAAAQVPVQGIEHDSARSRHVARTGGTQGAAGGQQVGTASGDHLPMMAHLQSHGNNESTPTANSNDNGYHLRHAEVVGPVDTAG
jgi:hypothetical protein